MRFLLSHATAYAMACAVACATLAMVSSAASAQQTDTTIAIGPGTVRIQTNGKKGQKPAIIRMFTDSAMLKRASLGMVLRTTGSKRDTLGLFVESVVADGPAEKAGIVEGDRIAEMNGVDLRVAAADLDDRYVANVSLHRLSRQVTKLTPGAKAELKVYSGGRYKTVTVTAAKSTDVYKNQPFEMHWGRNFEVAPGEMGQGAFAVIGGDDDDAAGVEGQVLATPDIQEMNDELHSQLLQQQRELQIELPKIEMQRQQILRNLRQVDMPRINAQVIQAQAQVRRALQAAEAAQGAHLMRVITVPAHEPLAF